MPTALRIMVRTRRFGEIILSRSKSGVTSRGGQYVDPAVDEGQRTYISEQSASERESSRFATDEEHAVQQS